MSVKNEAGETPLDLAAGQGYIGCCCVIMEDGDESKAQKLIKEKKVRDRWAKFEAVYVGLKVFHAV